MTKRAQVRDALAALLDAPGKPAGLTVKRRLVRDVRASELPMISIQSDRDDFEDEEQDSSGRIRTYFVDLLHMVLADFADPEKDVDELVAWTLSQLETDPTLGGLIVSAIEVDTEWFADEQDKVFAGAKVQFEITYSTLFGEV